MSTTRLCLYLQQAVTLTCNEMFEWTESKKFVLGSYLRIVEEGNEGGRHRKNQRQKH